MYHYPLLLLTADDIRNNAIADLLEDDLHLYVATKKQLYSTLPDTFVYKKQLYDNLEFRKISEQMLFDVFRSNMNVLTTTLPDIDNWRIKDKLKRMLTVMRRKSQDFIYPHDDDWNFSDKLNKSDLWEGHDSFTAKDGTPSQMNSVLLNRLSDVHKHVYKIAETCELRIYERNICLTNPDKSRMSDETISMIDNVGKMTESLRSINKELKEYIRLVDSL